MCVRTIWAEDCIQFLILRDFSLAISKNLFICVTNNAAKLFVREEMLMAIQLGENKTKKQVKQREVML